VYLPPDANTLLLVLADALAATGRINLIVAGKQPGPQWLDLASAREHWRRGVWEWAGHHDRGGDGLPDVVLACAGTTPTVETLAAAQLLRENAPQLRVRVSNVVDLRVLSALERYPEGLSDQAFRACFGDERTPVVFGFHGYPSDVHELLHGRPEPNRFHVHGYLEEGTTTTPYVLLACNRMTRHDLAADALRRVRGADDPLAGRLEADRDHLVAYAHRRGDHRLEMGGLMRVLTVNPGSNSLQLHLVATDRDGGGADPVVLEQPSSSTARTTRPPARSCEPCWRSTARPTRWPTGWCTAAPSCASPPGSGNRRWPRCARRSR